MKLPWRRTAVGRVRPVIRAGRVSDLADVQALLAATWAETYDSLLGPERVRQITAEWHSLARLAEQLGDPGSAFLVATVSGEMAGTGFAHVTGDGEAQIGRLYVHPRHQGGGIGARLLQELICRVDGARRFHLEVEPRNVRAIRFYERQGFSRAGMTLDCGGDDSGIAAVVMQRTCESRRPCCHGNGLALMPEDGG